jgi:hypothetical protein
VRRCVGGIAICTAAEGDWHEAVPAGALCSYERKHCLTTKFLLLSAPASWLAASAEARRVLSRPRERRAAVEAKRRAFTGSDRLCHKAF